MAPELLSSPDANEVYFTAVTLILHAACERRMVNNFVTIRCQCPSHFYSIVILDQGAENLHQLPCETVLLKKTSLH